MRHEKEYAAVLVMSFRRTILCLALYLISIDFVILMVSIVCSVCVECNLYCVGGDVKHCSLTHCVEFSQCLLVVI